MRQERRRSTCLTGVSKWKTELGQLKIKMIWSWEVVSTVNGVAISGATHG